MTRLFTSSFSHLILFIGIFIMIVPVWLIFASSTHTSLFINTQGLQFYLGDRFFENYIRVLLYEGGFFKEINALKMFFNSFIMATGVAFLSVVTSLMTAYVLVYYTCIIIYKSYAAACSVLSFFPLYIFSTESEKFSRTTLRTTLSVGVNSPFSMVNILGNSSNSFTRS